MRYSIGMEPSTLRDTSPRIHPRPAEAHALTTGSEAGPRNQPRFLGPIRDRIVASDPAFSRLRAAGRVILSLIITGGSLAAFYLLIHPLPAASFGIAFVICPTRSMMIRDPSSRDQLVSRIYAVVGAILSILLASVLAAWPIAAYLAFLLVIFIAVYIRRFGMRWFAVGMIAFMAYFMGDYLRPHLG